MVRLVVFGRIKVHTFNVREVIVVNFLSLRYNKGLFSKERTKEIEGV